jgi:hypothetical protein
MASTQEIIGPWFDLYIHVLVTYKIVPGLCFNMDETALFINKLVEGKAVTHIDCSVLPFSTTPERMPTATVLFSVCADFTHLPTIVLWPTKYLPPELSVEFDNIVFIPNGSGWETKDSFYHVMTTILIPAMKSKREELGDPSRFILVILDSHSSRCSSMLLIACSVERIILLTIPPHSSHIVQPNDRGPSATMKQALPAQLALSTGIVSEQLLSDVRHQRRSVLASQVRSSSSSSTSLPIPFTPPASSAIMPPTIARTHSTTTGRTRRLSKAARERLALAHAIPHVFARALAETVLQHAWEVSGLWPANKTGICSQLPASYTGPRPPPSSRMSLCPSIGGQIVNAPDMIEKIQAWEKARAARATPPAVSSVAAAQPPTNADAPVAPPPRRHTRHRPPVLLRDDGSDSGSDAAPIPLELLLVDDEADMEKDTPWMEKEPVPGGEEGGSGEEDEEGEELQDEHERPEAQEVEFSSDDAELLL